MRGGWKRAQIIKLRHYAPAAAGNNLKSLNTTAFPFIYVQLVQYRAVMLGNPPTKSVIEKTK